MTSLICSRSFASRRWNKICSAAWSSELIRRAFESTGIWPYNAETVSTERMHHEEVITERVNRHLEKHNEKEKTEVDEVLSIISRQIVASEDLGELPKAFDLLRQHKETMRSEHVTSNLLQKQALANREQVKEVLRIGKKDGRRRGGSTGLLSMSQDHQLDNINAEAGPSSRPDMVPAKTNDEISINDVLDSAITNMVV